MRTRSGHQAHWKEIASTFFQNLFSPNRINIDKFSNTNNFNFYLPKESAGDPPTDKVDGNLLTETPVVIPGEKLKIDPETPQGGIGQDNLLDYLLRHNNFEPGSKSSHRFAHRPKKFLGT
jgi:hypothetical protein